MKNSIFGTDGVRGEANRYPMTASVSLRIAQAAAYVLKNEHTSHRRVILGKDTRLSGYVFESALSAGLCSMGVDVLLVGPMPTPGVALLTQSMRADAGIMVSASHNLFQDNGIKLFGPDAFKLSDEIENKIEHLVASEGELDGYLPAGNKLGKAYRIDDAMGRYIAHLKFSFPRHLSLNGLKIVLDCANGATYKVAPIVFSELGAKVIPFACSPDGMNINEGCGAVSPAAMIQKVKTENADIGISFDGDGDRVVLCDEKGQLFDGDDILSVIFEHDSANQRVKGLVGTLMSNYGLERFCVSKGLPFYRSQVGDRHVVEKMKETGCNLGGESSGHILSFPESTTGDGILTALRVLSILVAQQKGLSAFRDLYERTPQSMKNIPVKTKPPIESIPELHAAISEVEKELEGKGRVLVRYSGTESVIRVMVESESDTLNETSLKKLSAVVNGCIGGVTGDV